MAACSLRHLRSQLPVFSAFLSRVVHLESTSYIALSLYQISGYAARQLAVNRQINTTKPSSPSPTSPLVILIRFPACRVLARPQRLRKASRQAGVRRAVRRAASTAAGRVLRVHAHCAVSGLRRWRWSHFARGHVGPLRWGRWRSRLGLRRCSRCRPIRRRGRCCRGCWGRGWSRDGRCRRRCGLGRWRYLLFKICFRRPALHGGRHVHTQPPACMVSLRPAKRVIDVPFPSLETI